MFQSDDEIIVVFDPATTDPQQIATMYSLMQEMCEEVQIKRIPKPKNKSSYQFH